MASSFALRLAGIAQEQHDRFHRVTENDEPLKSQIKIYWTGIGLRFPGVGTAWSAVFVSWCVKEAGAKDTEFEFSQAHSRFVHTAIQNGINGTGVFRGLPITAHAPQVGDIIHNNRDGKRFSFNFARENKKYESHSAIVAEIGVDSQGGFALTVGGNESDSIRETIVRLDNNGFVKQRTRNPYICVIKNMK